MPIVELTIDSSGALTGAKEYETAVDRISGSTGKAQAAMGKLRAGINSMGPMMAAAAAAVGTAVVALGTHAVKLASDLEETQNKFDVVFSGMTETAEKWATNLQENYMMTAEESKRFLASTQDLLKPMGVATEQAGKMSFATAQLAADLGSFNNLETADVMAKIQSALVGNYESVKSLGIVINKTRVEANAYATGLAEMGTELTQAQIAQSALDLIMKGSKDAIGDMARSSGSYALQMKQLKTNLTELTTQIGTVLLPIATQVVTSINEWISKQENLNRVLDGAVEVVRFLYNAYNGLILVLKGVIVAVAKWAEFTTKAFRTVMKPADLLFSQIEKFGGPKNPFSTMTEAVEMFSAAAVEDFTKTMTKVEDFNAVLDRAKSGTDTLAGSMGNATIKGGEFEDTLGGIVTGLSNIEANANGAAVATDKVYQSMQLVNGTWTNAAGAASNLSRELGISIAQVEGLSEAQLASIKMTDQDKQSKDAAKHSTSQLTNANNQLAQSYGQVAGAAASAASAVASVAGGGKGYTSGMTGARSGRFELPSWFSEDMISAYGRHVSDILVKGTPHLPGKFIQGYGSSAMGKRTTEARSEYYQQQYDPTSFAAKYLRESGISDFQGNVETSSGITLNIYQEMSKDQLEALIAELERAGARQ